MNSYQPEGNLGIDSEDQIKEEEDVMEDEEIRPSKVLHGRNLPSDVNKNELTQLASKFGNVENILILTGKAKNQAFIQMEQLSAATSFINFYSSNPPLLRYFFSFL